MKHSSKVIPCLNCVQVRNYPSATDHFWYHSINFVVWIHSKCPICKLKCKFCETYFPKLSKKYIFKEIRALVNEIYMLLIDASKITSRQTHIIRKSKYWCYMNIYVHNYFMSKHPSRYHLRSKALNWQPYGVSFFEVIRAKSTTGWFLCFNTHILLQMNLHPINTEKLCFCTQTVTKDWYFEHTKPDIVSEVIADEKSVLLDGN